MLISAQTIPSDEVMMHQKQVKILFIVTKYAKLDHQVLKRLFLSLMFKKYYSLMFYWSSLVP